MYRIECYRTPIIPFGTYEIDTNSLLQPVLARLNDLINIRFKEFRIERFVFSSTFEINKLKIYPFRILVRKYGINLRIEHTTLQYIDSHCLSLFDGLLTMMRQNIRLGIFVAYENLSYYSRNELLEIIKTSPDEDYKSPWEIDEVLSNKYKIHNSEMLEYINLQKSIVIKRKDLVNIIPIKTHKKQIINSDPCCINKIPVFRTRNNDIYLARLASGASFIVLYNLDNLTCEASEPSNDNIGIVGIGEASSLNEIDSLEFLFASIEKALENASLRIQDIDSFEIMDSHPVYTLAIIKKFNISMSKVNNLGSVLLRGDSVSAAGGTLFTNTKTLYDENKNFRYILLVSYSVSMAISFIVKKALD